MSLYTGETKLFTGLYDRQNQSARAIPHRATVRCGAICGGGVDATGARLSKRSEVPQWLKRIAAGYGAFLIPVTLSHGLCSAAPVSPNSPCLICGRQPCDAHHLRFAQSRGLGQKVSDEFTVPLCRADHRELHRAGKELDWWAKTRIEPTGLARKLWLETHAIGGSETSSDAVTTPVPTADIASEIGPPISQKKPAMKTAKRTQLPGLPT